MSRVATTPAPHYDMWPPRACAGMDTAAFFPHLGWQSKHYQEQAKKVCRRCPAMRLCRAYALPITDLEGVWGAMTAEERAEVRKRRAGGVGARKKQKEAGEA